MVEKNLKSKAGVKVPSPHYIEGHITMFFGVCLGQEIKCILLHCFFVDISTCYDGTDFYPSAFSHISHLSQLFCSLLQGETGTQLKELALHFLQRLLALPHFLLNLWDSRWTVASPSVVVILTCLV